MAPVASVPTCVRGRGPYSYDLMLFHRHELSSSTHSTRRDHPRLKFTQGSIRAPSASFVSPWVCTVGALQLRKLKTASSALFWTRHGVGSWRGLRTIMPLADAQQVVPHGLGVQGPVAERLAVRSGLLLPGFGCGGGDDRCR